MDFFEIRNWFAHRFCECFKEGNRESLEILKLICEVILNGKALVPSERINPETVEEVVSSFPLVREEGGVLFMGPLDSITEEYLKEKAIRYLRFLNGKKLEPVGEDVFKTVSLSVEMFKEGLFFEVHEMLEELWSNTFTEEREFLQSLIQIGVAFYHRDNFNQRGYVLLLENALELLEKYDGVICGINIAALKENIKKAMENSDYDHRNLFKSSL